MVTINKKWQNNPPSIVKKAKNFYMSTMCNCARLQNGGIVNCTFPQTAKNSKSHGHDHDHDHDDDQDLQELIRLAAVSCKKGGGTRVEVDSKGNLVWKNSGEEGTNYGAGVGRMGRIDEDRTCDFKETDVTKVWYTRSFGTQKMSNIN